MIRPCSSHSSSSLLSHAISLNRQALEACLSLERGPIVVTENAGQTRFKYGDLTSRIIACAMDVQSEMGSGYLESVYQKSLALVMEEAGLAVEEQKALVVRFRNHIVGIFYADFVIEETIVLELKVARAWAPEHEAQIIHYLKCTGLEVGLLLNFGKPRLDFRRIARHLEFDGTGSESEIDMG